MKHLCSFLFVACFSLFANAQENYDLTGRWGLGIGAGMSSASGPEVYKDGARELEGKWAGSIWGRYHLTSRFGMELAYTRLAQEFKSPALSGLSPALDILDLGFAYRMWPTEQFHVVLQVGAGYARISDFAGPPDDKMDDFAIKARLGFEYMATQDLMLALHGDYFNVNLGSGNDSQVRLLVPMLAVTYYFGGEKTPVNDADGDGVSNDLDKCPGTARGSEIDADGCPKIAFVDTDKDGIADIDDQCPGTPAGAKVNAFGCAQTEKLEFTLNVQFATGSATVDPQYVDDLEKFSEFLKKHSDAKAEIEGHTDNTGSEKLNYSISQKRAQAVVSFLVKKYGVDKKRLTAKGYGPSQPVAENTTPEGRTKNRRVVAHVITQ
jgi:outer membrane protein OmpA-like peptidoglycan-associated protein